MRLDKLLANMGYGSRKDVKGLIKSKKVLVNDVIVKDSGLKVDPLKDIVHVNGDIVSYQKYIYIMLHKPKGVVSATTDRIDKTVIDLLTEKERIFHPFPVGRLDKDTEGLLLLTNDGDLAHQLTSPKKDVNKLYFAKIDGKVSEEDVNRFNEGVILEDGYKTKPAQLIILKAGDISEVEITITEGKYHQIKRMFQAVGKEVMYLKRLQMGELQLDESLRLGEFRELFEDEIEYCKSLTR